MNVFVIMCVQINSLIHNLGRAKGDKIGVDHFFEAQNKGEISENNVLYLIQNMNVAGKCQSLC